MGAPKEPIRIPGSDNIYIVDADHDGHFEPGDGIGIGNVQGDRFTVDADKGTGWTRDRYRRLQEWKKDLGIRTFSGPIDKLKSSLFPLLKEFKEGKRWVIAENMGKLKSQGITVGQPYRSYEGRELKTAMYLRKVADCYLEKEYECKIDRPISLIEQVGKRKYIATVPALVDLLALTPKVITNISASFIVSSLISIGEKTAASVLIEKLKNRSGVYDIETFVYWSGSTGFKSLVPELRRMYDDGQENYKVRVMALWAMGRTGDPSVNPLLVKVLKNDQRSDYIRSAAQGLMWSGDESALPALIEGITTKRKRYKDVDALEAVIKALGTTVVREGGLDNDRRSVVLKALKRIHKRTKESTVRGAAIFAMGQIGDQSIVPFLIKGLKRSARSEKIIFEYPIGWFFSQGFTAHQAYALALGYIGGKEAVKALVDAFKKAADVQITKKRILHALVKAGDKAVVPALIAAREKEKDKFVVEAIDRAVKELRKPLTILK